MAHRDLKTDIQKILENGTYSRDEQVKRLENMRENVRQEMRAATESTMVDDDEIGDDLKLLDAALDKLDDHPESIEDKGAATL